MNYRIEKNLTGIDFSIEKDLTEINSIVIRVIPKLFQQLQISLQQLQFSMQSHNL